MTASTTIDLNLAMPRKALTQIEIDCFRDTFCKTAYDLYVSEGYHGVTMRGIAKGLGCSPMMAYRYFENKEHVFASLRAMLFHNLAKVLETVPVQPSSAHYLRELGKAYAAYAHQSPHAYRLLYVVPMPSLKPCFEVEEAQQRTQKVLFDATRRAVESRDIKGEPVLMAYTLWASIHGLVSLDLANQLTQGASFNDLFPAMLDHFLQDE
jgi:AcrR family transcriptional regulator